MQDVAELRGALVEARREAGPCVIVAETAKAHFLPGSGVWWDVAPAAVSTDPETQDAPRGVRRGAGCPAHLLIGDERARLRDLRAHSGEQVHDV